MVMSGDEENSNVVYVNFKDDYPEDEILFWLEIAEEFSVVIIPANTNRKVFD